MNLLEMQETWVPSLGREDPLEEGMATHSSMLAWRIPMERAAWWATVHGVAGRGWFVEFSSMYRFLLSSQGRVWVSSPRCFIVGEAWLLLLLLGLCCSASLLGSGGRRTCFLEGSLAARRVRYFSTCNPLVGRSVESPLLSTSVLLGLCTPVNRLSSPPPAGKDAKTVRS